MQISRIFRNRVNEELKKPTILAIRVLDSSFNKPIIGFREDNTNRLSKYLTSTLRNLILFSNYQTI